MNPVALAFLATTVPSALFSAIAKYRNIKQAQQQQTPPTPTATPTPQNVLGTSVGFAPTTTPTTAPQQNVVPTPSGEVVENNGVDYAEIERKIRKGLVDYGGESLPALQQVPSMMEAIKKYPLFRANPYLLPQQTILETSGGRNVTYPNNYINYGIRSKAINDLFKEVGPAEALSRSAKEMGETGTVYKRFRTGNELSDTELDDYAKQYEPTNPEYPRNLREGIKYFKSK